MRRPVLYIWKRNVMKESINAIVPDFTLMLYLLLIVLFTIYGATTAFLIPYIEKWLEPFITQVNLHYFLDNPLSKDTIDSYVKIAEEGLDFSVYFLLAVLVKHLCKQIMDTANHLSGNQPTFTAKEVNHIIRRALMLTALFLITYAVFERKYADICISASITNFVVSGFISLEFNEDRSTTPQPKEPKEKHRNRAIKYIFIVCLISIPFPLIITYFSNLHPIALTLVWLFILITSLCLFFLYRSERTEIKRTVTKRIMGNDVLMFGKTSYGSFLQNTIFRSVKRNYARSKEISQILDNRKMDTIIVINPIGDKEKLDFLTNQAKSMLANNGVIIAPAYTTKRKKSSILSPQEYRSRLRKMGFEIQLSYVTKFKSITYVELSNPPSS